MAIPYGSIYEEPDAIVGNYGSGTPTAANLLRDRNFLALLSGVGAGLDPKGVGGAIGGPTRQYIAMQAAQERADKQAAAQSAQTKLALKVLSEMGGLSSVDNEGITSIKATPKGGVVFDATPPGGGADKTFEQAPPSGGIQTAPVQTPNTTNFNFSPPNPYQFNAPSFTPTSSQYGNVSVEPTRIGSNVSSSRRNVNNLLPFYSALLQV